MATCSLTIHRFSWT